EVAHGGGPLLRHEVAPLVLVDGLASREHRRPGELRVGHLVVDEPAPHAEAVTWIDPGGAEPPLVAAEDHVGARDVADDRRAGAVADVAADGERLWRHDAPEHALRRVLLVVVERV